MMVKKAAGLWMALAVMAMAGSTAAYGGETDTYVTGTYINGTDVSGQTVDGARAVLELSLIHI